METAETGTDLPTDFTREKANSKIVCKSEIVYMIYILYIQGVQLKSGPYFNISN
jgi:hypothetical protein